MNRFLSILLSALLLVGLCVPAMAAEESADARLKRITQVVKDTLDLDTEAFTDFYGDVYEQELGTVWTLNWSGNGTTLDIQALEDGTVLHYSRGDNDTAVSPIGGLPTLPKVDVKAATAAAEAFLARVLDAKAETVALDEPVSAGRLGSAVCRFSGTILLNGLPSPLGYSISVRGGDNVVTSFRRDALATLFLGNIPSAKPAVSSADAAKSLRDTLKLELQYVKDENDAQTAVLRYVPKNVEVFCVDAQTGKLVAPDADIFEYANDAATPSAGAAADEGAANKLAMTQAELDGIQKLEGVLDSAALDRLVRAEAAYKLDGYSLATANYRIVKDGESETVLCTIRYAAAEDKDGFASSRTFTVDARSGAVKALYSSARWDKERKSAVSVDGARKMAEDFLARFSSHAGEFALYDTDDSTADGAPFYRFTFARRANGIFFPENSCTLQIDCVTGAVAGVSYTYDETVRFDTADGLISADAALSAWMDSFDVRLAYRALPKELSRSNSAEAKLIDLGYTRFRTLFLSYALEREADPSGVDAKTGKLIAPPERNGKIAYGDVSGHWAAEEIELLARYGVGYGGESFRPDKALTQWELVALLVSTRGMHLDPDKATSEEKDSAYENAYRMGALTRGERNDASIVTRAALVRYLLDAAGCGTVAKLPGIFACSYSDRDSIPAGGLGYAALAQGFGLVSGERYDGEASATRAVAAIMLCRLMQRAG